MRGMLNSTVRLLTTQSTYRGCLQQRCSDDDQGSGQPWGNKKLFKLEVLVRPRLLISTLTPVKQGMISAAHDPRPETL